MTPLKMIPIILTIKDLNLDLGKDTIVTQTILLTSEKGRKKEKVTFHHQMMIGDIKRK